MQSGFSNENEVAGGNRKVGRAHLGHNEGSHV